MTTKRELRRELKHWRKRAHQAEQRLDIALDALRIRGQKLEERIWPHHETATAGNKPDNKSSNATPTAASAENQ